MEKLEFGNLDHIKHVKDYRQQADIEDAKDDLSELLYEVDNTPEQIALLDALNDNEVLNDSVQDILEDLDRLHDSLSALQVAQ